MPSLITFGRGHTTGVDLGANAFWRIMLGATSATEMGLVVVYPPGGTSNRISLASVEVNIAKQVQEIEQVAKTCLSMGTLDGDIARATEAMNLFRMHSHVGDKAFEEAVGQVLLLVRAYWQLRTWFEQGAAERLVIDTVPNWKIHATP